MVMPDEKYIKGRLSTANILHWSNGEYLFAVGIPIPQRSIYLHVPMHLNIRHNITIQLVCAHMPYSLISPTNRSSTEFELEASLFCISKEAVWLAQLLERTVIYPSRSFHSSRGHPFYIDIRQSIIVRNLQLLLIWFLRLHLCTRRKMILSSKLKFTRRQRMSGKILRASRHHSVTPSPPIQQGLLCCKILDLRLFCFVNSIKELCLCSLFAWLVMKLRLFWNGFPLSLAATTHLSDLRLSKVHKNQKKVVQVGGKTM